MRIAVLVIGLCLVMLVGMQSCTVMFGGGLTEDQNLAGAGALGLLVALLFILGSAFAIGAPKASVGIFRGCRPFCLWRCGDERFQGYERLGLDFSRPGRAFLFWHQGEGKKGNGQITSSKAE